MSLSSLWPVKMIVWWGSIWKDEMADNVSKEISFSCEIMNSAKQNTVCQSHRTQWVYWWHFCFSISISQCSEKKKKSQRNSWNAVPGGGCFFGIINGQRVNIPVFHWVPFKDATCWAGFVLQPTRTTNKSVQPPGLRQMTKTVPQGSLCGPQHFMWPSTFISSVSPLPSSHMINDGRAAAMEMNEHRAVVGALISTLRDNRRHFRTFASGMCGCVRPWAPVCIAVCPTNYVFIWVWLNKREMQQSHSHRMNGIIQSKGSGMLFQGGGAHSVNKAKALSWWKEVDRQRWQHWITCVALEALNGT